MIRIAATSWVKLVQILGDEEKSNISHILEIKGRPYIKEYRHTQNFKHEHKRAKLKKYRDTVEI